MGLLCIKRQLRCFFLVIECLLGLWCHYYYITQSNSTVVFLRIKRRLQTMCKNCNDCLPVQFTFTSPRRYSNRFVVVVVFLKKTTTATTASEERKTTGGIVNKFNGAAVVVLWKESQFSYHLVLAGWCRTGGNCLQQVLHKFVASKVPTDPFSENK